MEGNSARHTDISMNPRIQKDRQLIVESRQKNTLATLGAFFRLSGPGWLQSAITLGGGSLSSSLYLGVLVGFSFLWLQPLAMILGIMSAFIALALIVHVVRRPSKRSS